MDVSKKRTKRNVPEFEPPEKQYIERLHCQKEINFDIKNIKILNSDNFKDMLSDYIYELNFPKDSILQEIKFLFTPMLQSITLPGSLTTIGPRSFQKCKFLHQIEFIKNNNDENNLSYIGDNAFNRTIIESITLPDKIKEIGSFCFPHTLKQIDFENGAPYLVKINDNAFDNTQIEIFKMPLNITLFIHAKNVFSNCKKLKTIIFDHYANKSKPFSIKDEKECLQYHDMFCKLQIEKIELFATNISNFLFYNTPKLNDITISKSDNSKYIKQDGCLYTKDKKKLIVAERNVKSAKIFKECQIISNHAFNVKCFEKVSFEENSELKKISFFAFFDSKIKEISLPNSVTDIEECSFLNCKNLEIVNIPTSLNLLKMYTFSGTNLREITIPKNITNIDSYCFYNCTQLKKVTFESDSNLLKIDDFAFSNTKIESISIPNNVKEIGNYSFSNCNELKSIEFDDSNSNLTNLGIGCFSCTQIRIFQLPQKIQRYDFSSTNAKIINFNNFCSISSISSFNSSTIEQISIPSNVVQIDSHAFHDCVNLREFVIIDSKNSKLEKISDYSFANCKKLAVFDIPEKVKYFGICSFQNTENYVNKIKLINDDDEIIVCKNAFDKSGIISFESKSQSIKINDFAFLESMNLSNLSCTINKKCKLGSSVFVDCVNLMTVELSLNTKKVEIGESCFMNSSIQKFEVPLQLKKIPKFCFKNCENLSDLIIHENSKITEFCSEAFFNSNIKEIFIPSQTKLIEKLCFSECKSLKSVTFSKDLQDCSICEKAFYQSAIEQLDVPIGITKIDIGCFEKCEKLKQVNFSEDTKITKIQYKAFKSSGIVNLTLPSSISSIEKSAFENCKQLQKVNFLCDEVSISLFAFSGCNSLEEIKYDLLLSIKVKMNDQYKTVKFNYEEIEKELIEALFVSKEPLFQLHQKVPFNLFYFLIDDKWSNNKSLCNKLTSFKTGRYYIFEKKNNGYYVKNGKELITCDFFTESLNISKETEIIHLSAFKYSLLKKIDFETNSNLQFIDNHAFENLQIEEISLPDSLKIIGDWAFDHCKLLKKVKINSKSELEIIGQFAFCCTAIESILFPSKLTKVDSYAFYECFNLRTVENHSNQMKFKRRCFSYSSIENIQFPQISTFSYDSFNGCYKLKQLKFLGEEPKRINFKEHSFSCSGLEEINLKSYFNIKMNAFSDCKSLKKVTLIGLDNKIMNNSFTNSNNIEFISFEKRIGISNKKKEENPLFFQYFNDILNTNIKKASIKIHFCDIKTNKDILVHDFYLENYCYVVNNMLVYADMLNKDLLTDKDDDDDDDKNKIRKNEVIHVPSNVKKLCFPRIEFIKNIIWDTNCIVDDLGPPGFFSYYNLTQISISKLVKKIPSKLFEHCHYLSSVNFDKDSLLEEIGEFSFANTRISKIILPKTLRKISKNAFCDNLNLQEVVFDGEIIDDEAFSNTGIKSFKLSNNTTRIGSYAFQYCRSLTEFEIDIHESNLSEIGQNAFQETSLNEIKIPAKIKVIKKFTFNGCNKLKEVVFSNESELTSIETHSFSGNLSLEKINLPKTIKNLSFNAFINTPSLQSIMNESNQYFNVIDNKAVYRKDWSLIFVPRNLNKFEINEKCSMIHCGSFCGPNLNQVVFPANSLLKTIGKLSFAHCTGLKEITVPNSVLKLGNECFIGCQNLEKVEFELNSRIKVIPKYCFAFSGLKSIDLPKSIIKIDNSSFLMCQNLEKIDLFNTNINYIGHCAFSGTNINEVKFPSSLEFIGNNAFGGNKNLKKIDFSEFDEIEENEFKTKTQYNSLLLTKYFANNEENEKDETLNNSKCIENLSENSINKNSMNENLSENSEIENNSSFIEQQDELENNDFNNEKEEVLESKSICYVHQNAFSNSIVKCFKFNLNHFEWFYFFEKCKEVEEYIVNDDIQFTLHKSSTKNKSKSKTRPSFEITKLKWENQEEITVLSAQLLTEFNISKMTKFLCPYHFSCCSKLTTINFEKGIEIKKILENCFSNTPLKKITIPSSVIVIENSAFFGCTELEEVNISNESRLKSIENNAFCKCLKLTKIKIPENLRMISMNCFSFTGLKRIEIPSSVQIIDKNAFLNCKELSQIILNDGIEEIKDFSFAFNTSLESIDFPDSLKIIQLKSFYKCTNLKQVKTTEKTNLIEIHDSAFEMTQIEEIFINKNATKLFDPKNMTNLKKIEFYNGKPTNFIQLDDGTIYEKYNKYLKVNEIDEEELNKNLLTKILASNSYCGLNYNEIKQMDVKDLNGNYSEDAFNIMLNKNRSRFPKDELSQHPILRLLFVPKNLNVLKIHEDCFAISQYVIQNFDNFTSIEYAKSTTNFVFNFTGISYQMTQKLTTIKILGDYSYLNKNCFAHFESLKTVEFGPKTEVLLIPEYAFYGCKKLEQIIIPSSCISIEEGAFKDCKSLSLIKFGSNESQSKLKYIRKESFYNCSSLESIEIPSTVLIICESAFMNCINLQKVEFKEDESELKFVSKNVFRNCTSLTSFKLPKTCIILGPLSFMNCAKLEEFEYEGENLKSIQCRTFYNCCSLKRIKIVNLSYKINYKKTYSKDEIKDPIDKSFFTINSEAFMNCSSLTEFIIEDKSRKINTIKFDKNQQPLSLTPIHNLFTHRPSSNNNYKLYIKYNLLNLFQKVQKRAFYNCKSLKLVRLFLGNLESFHSEAFGNCSSLKIIEINSQYSFYLVSDGLDQDAFSGTPNDLELNLFNNEKCIKKIPVLSCIENKNLNNGKPGKRNFPSEKDHLWDFYGNFVKKK